MKAQLGKNQRFWIIVTSMLMLTIALGVGSLTGCETMEGAMRHGWEGADYEGKLLPASDELGARALDNWTKLDLDTRKFLEKYRRPDYVFNESMLRMQFFYVKENALVTFKRPMSGPHTEITTSPIPEDIRRALVQGGTK